MMYLGGAQQVLAAWQQMQMQPMPRRPRLSDQQHQRFMEQLRR